MKEERSFKRRRSKMTHKQLYTKVSIPSDITHVDVIYVKELAIVKSLNFVYISMMQLNEKNGVFDADMKGMQIHNLINSW